MKRAGTSVGPPALKPTTSRTGLSGEFWACAPSARSAAASPGRRICTNRKIALRMLTPCVGLPLRRQYKLVAGTRATTMKRGEKRIRTTHTGSLPRPPQILATLHAQADGRPYNKAAHEKTLREQVFDIVRRQVEAGIDVVNDGECSKPSCRAYLTERIGGFEARIPKGGVPMPSPVDLQGRDAGMFPDYYQGVGEHSPYARAVRVAPRVCVAPMRYSGNDMLDRELRNLQGAIDAAGCTAGLLPISSSE